ncbi:hypothetical protein H4K35_00010 [Myroides sp. NP-2]|uniref:hypothetical protein n=1 Tax=Myroides sp. NP-2 TaxID=2759945 RepID=UPI0015F8B29D|nr:hypothetical protein [Myroides sp. NP-2]MBB1148531.1 hypothetical protein [Myroides sp. NP-2]
MDQKKLYGKWFFWDELVGYPMMLYYWIKGNKINKLLDIRIEKARIKASRIELTKKIKNEFLIEYDKQDNFFSYHFKNIDESRDHNFQDKINYCLLRFRDESKRNLSSSKLMILQENFLNGAEHTLFLYFALEGKVKRDIRLSDIMIGEKSAEYFLLFLKEKKFIDENHNLLVDKKSFLIRIHHFLKDHHIINPDFQDITIIKAMENEYNSNFDRGTFSRAVTAKLNDFEEIVFKELSILFNIRY